MGDIVCPQRGIYVKSSYRPSEVVVLGKVYTISYMDKPSDVDLFKRETMWGQIDYWTRSIRIYEGEFGDIDVWDTLIHEVLHAIGVELHLSLAKDEKHEELGMIALALADVMIRNGWLEPSISQRELTLHNDGPISFTGEGLDS